MGKSVVSLPTAGEGNGGRRRTSLKSKTAFVPFDGMNDGYDEMAHYSAKTGRKML